MKIKIQPTHIPGADRAVTVNIHADDGSEIALVNCIVSESSTGEVALSVVHASVKDGPTEATGASLDAAAAALADHFAA